MTAPLDTSNCDIPQFAGADPALEVPNAGWDFPHDIATGTGSIIALIDTGASVAKVTGYRDSCQLHGSAVATVLIQAAPHARVHSIGYSPNRHEPEGTLPELVDALREALAIESGRKIINISLVTCEDSTLLHEAITDLTNSGALVIASAGNSGQCAENAIAFPAAYPEVMSVGAIEPPSLDSRDTTDVQTLNLGRIPAQYNLSETADVYAPGGPVIAAVEPTAGAPVQNIVGSPDPFIGTSFATPMISATAALVWQANPLLTAKEVRDVIVTSALPSANGHIVANPRTAVTVARDALRDPSMNIAHSATSDETATNSIVQSGSVQPVAKDYFVPLMLSALLATVLIVALVARAFSSDRTPPSGKDSTMRHGTKP